MKSKLLLLFLSLFAFAGGVKAETITFNGKAENVMSKSGTGLTVNLTMKHYSWGGNIFSSLKQYEYYYADKNTTGSSYISWTVATGYKVKITSVVLTGYCQGNNHSSNYYVGDSNPTSNEWTKCPVLFSSKNSSEKTITFSEGYTAQGTKIYFKVGGGECDITKIVINYEVEDAIELDESSDDNTNVSSTKAGVTVKRTLKTNSWNTFCLPFEYAKPSDWEVKEMTGVTEDGNGNYTLTFTNATKIEAGKPYLVKPTSAVTEITADEVAVNTNNITSKTVEGFSFVPNMSKMSAPQGSYIISSNAFYLVDSEVNLKGFRGYFTASTGGVKAMSYVLDEATVINALEAQEEKGVMYDMAGRKLNSKPAHGMYIMNGKKYFVK